MSTTPRTDAFAAQYVEPNRIAWSRFARELESDLIKAEAKIAALTAATADMVDRWESTPEWHEPPFLDGEIHIRTGDLYRIACAVKGESL